jgi:LPXTG-motif cell wall-anchored protein
MRTRIAIGFVLAFGILFSGATVAMAQISDSGQAAQVQYPDINTRAEAPEDSDLPLTGFVAFPLLITGAALLLTGGVMHLRTRRE